MSDTTTSSCPVPRPLREVRLRQALERFGLAQEADGDDVFAALLAMKVAMIGNMNNNFFAISRYFADAGIDVTLLSYPFETAHFRPECDSYREDHGVAIQTLPWSHVMAADPDWLYSHVSRFGYLFGCGLTPAFMTRIGLDLDVMFPYGSDLYEYPFLWADTEDYEKHKDPSRYFFGKWQAEGYSWCRTIWTYDKFVPVDVGRLTDRPAFVEMSPPIVHRPSFEGEALDEAMAKSPHAAAFRRIRESHELVVFHHTRHLWVGKTQFDEVKGNDKLIRGFAAFTQRHPAVTACLVMFEYGPDFEASKALVADLGLAEKVVWFPKMYRRDLLLGITLSDVVAGYFDLEFRYGGVVNEALSMGKPLLHSMGDYTEVTKPRDTFDYIQANTAEAVAEALTDYIRRPEHYAEIGRSGRRWYCERMEDRTLAWCLGAFVERAREQLREPRRHERQTRQLGLKAADLQTDLDSARAEIGQFRRLARTLFGDENLKDCPSDLAWYMRAGIMLRRLLGDKPLDAIPPEVVAMIRRHLDGGEPHG